MLAELKLKHREVARLSFDGFKPADIAVKTDISLATVYKILRDPMATAYINGLSDRVDKTSLDVRERLMKLSANALDAFDEILSSDTKAPYSVIASVGKDVLDRTGHKAPEKANINLTLQGKSDEELDAQIAAIESQLASTYNADLTSDEDDLEEEDPDDVYSSTTHINPLTDSKESN